MSRFLPIPLKVGKQSTCLVCKIDSKPSSFPIELSATDGEYVYYAKLSRNDLKRNENFDSSQEGWEQLVVDALFATENKKDGIQISALRKKSEGKDKKDKRYLVEVNIERFLADEDLNVRLGTFDIAQSDIEVDLIAWLDECASAATSVELKLRAIEKETSKEQDIIDSLEAQLETLVQAKKDYERELLIKVNMLLNEKKAKIRELTNNGPVPEARIPEPEDEPEVAEKPAKGSRKGKPASKPAAKKAIKPPPPTRKAGASARGKRKRTPTPEPEEPEQEDVAMPDVAEEEDEEDVTQDEDESVQGDDERDRQVERSFGMRNDEEGDVTEDEEL